MRIILLAALVATTALAGCSGSDGLSAHVVARGDLGSGFAYWEVPSEAQDEGLNGNPGSFDVSDFGDEGATGGYLSAFTYNGSEDPIIVSQAIRFQNATAAQDFFDNNGGCSENAFVSIDGSTLSLTQFLSFFAEDLDQDMLWEEAHDAAHAVQERTGGTDICGDESH